jgi:HSP20 family molecular chaperone IbpA
MSERSDDASAARAIRDGLDRLADALRGLADAGEVEQTVRFGDEDEGFGGVMHVHARTGLGADPAPRARRPAGAASAAGGDSAPAAAAQPPTDARRPAVQVEDEADRVRIVAEMPGVAPADVQWTVDGRALALDAACDRGRYWRAVELPRPVDADAGTVTAEHGVVELTFPAE